MPSWDLFEAQPDDYRVEVLPPGVPDARGRGRCAFGWERYADDVVSIDRFGASAPGDVVMRELGITPEHTVERALALLGSDRSGVGRSAHVQRDRTTARVRAEPLVRQPHPRRSRPAGSTS